MNYFKNKKIFQLKYNIFLILLLNSSLSHADEQARLSIGGMLDLSIPAYQFTEKKYDVGFKPVFFYDNDTFYSEGDEIGVYLYQDDQNEFRVNAYYDDLEFSPDYDYRDLKKRKWSILAGTSYMRITPYGAFKFQIAKDTLSRNNGTVITTSYLAEIKNNLWTWYPEFGLKRNSHQYNEYYYGISNLIMNKDDIQIYKPKSSVNPYLSLNGSYFVKNNWNIIFDFEFNYLTNQIFNSPLINNKMDYDFSIGALYTF